MRTIPTVDRSEFHTKEGVTLFSIFSFGDRNFQAICLTRQCQQGKNPINQSVKELQNCRIRDHSDDSSIHQHELCDALHPGHREVGLWRRGSALWKVHFWLKASSVGRDRLLVLNKVVRVVVPSHLPLPCEGEGAVMS